ncbi:hypothetical protein Goari_011042, partial [Gossypium aridum]|nr:hypothetical protein [Gossypium aridum]
MVMWLVIIFLNFVYYMIYASKIDNLNFNMSHKSIIDWQITWPKLFLVILIGYRFLKTHLILLNLCLKKMLIE